ncbi:hypothetical protein [Tunicatimonas pelagia]|uniref:hypothetical protein n=1 Tax=Tunicatimonas pelagia TaxID=931531 RepID=UPI002664FB3A|nr:hypothetical protein [Tunicatimonas pelagia]WKN43043.1 hypothetical protein P0M28_28805 [Tunicatimonas pelagia]
MKIKRLFVSLAALLFTSCATLLNRPVTNMVLHTSEPTTIVYQSDTLYTNHRNRCTILVDRSPEPIELSVKQDSLFQSISIPSKNAHAYYLNIVYSAGLGMLADKDRPERYAYPRRIYLDLAETPPTYDRYGNQRYVRVSTPYVNHFRLAPANESDKINTGFWGFSLGLDHYHSPQQYLNFTVGAVTDFDAPILVPYERVGEKESMFSVYFNLSNNHQISRFHLGYGLSYAINTWQLRYHDRFNAPPPTREPTTKTSHALGAVVPAYVQLGEQFMIGVVYRPTFLRFNANPTLAYEHLISLDFVWRVHLN